MKQSTFLYAALAVLGATAARADTITQCITYQTYDPGDGDGPSLNVALFDPSLGTLTGVTFTYTGNISIDVVARILTGGAPEAPYMATATPSFFSLFPSQPFFLPSAPVTVVDPGPTATATGYEAFSINGIFAPSYVESIPGNPCSRTCFAGPTLIGFNPSDAIFQNVNGEVDQNLYQDNSTAIGTFILTYIYTPVPEPGSLALMAAAIPALLLGAHRVRRQ
jgi:hypothetical protein